MMFSYIFSHHCFYIILTIILIFPLCCAFSPLDVKMDAKAIQIHRIDSMNQLIYTCLMMMAVLTVYAFKVHPVKYVHESGLSLIYGVAIGALIKYVGDANTSYTYLKVVPQESAIRPTDSPEIWQFNHSWTGSNQTNLTSKQFDIPPDSLWIPLQIETKDNHTTTHTYVYSFKGELINENESAGDALLSSKATFDPEIFFNIILPPIIFNAGYTLQRKFFFRNLDAILTFALLGTFLSTIITAMVLWLILQGLLPTLSLAPSDCLYFGAAISATDPVTVLSIFGELNVQSDLNALVLGESILNDALAIVLADSVDRFAKHLDTFFISFINLVKQYWQVIIAGNWWPIHSNVSLHNMTIWTNNSAIIQDTQSECIDCELLLLFGHVFILLIGSLALGVLISLISALAIKFSKLRHHPPLDNILLILSAYACFCAAESFALSGVVALLSCGICHAKYTSKLLHKSSAKFTRQFSQLLAFLADNFVFAYLGASLFTYPGHYWHFGFSVATLIAAQVGRVANVYPLSWIINLFRHRSIAIPFKYQHILFASGLRGAMAYSLALRNTLTKPRRLVLSATCVVAMTSVLGAGAYTSSFLQWLDIPRNPTRKKYQKIKNQPTLLDSNHSGLANGNDVHNSKSSSVQNNNASVDRHHHDSHYDSLWSLCSDSEDHITNSHRHHQHHHSNHPHHIINNVHNNSNSNSNSSANSNSNGNRNGSNGNSNNHHRVQSTDHFTDLDTQGNPNNQHVVQLADSNQESQRLVQEAFGSESTASPKYSNVYQTGRISQFLCKLDRCVLRPMFTDQQPTLLDYAPSCLHWFAYLFTSHRQLQDRCVLAKRRQSVARCNLSNSIGSANGSQSVHPAAVLVNPLSGTSHVAN